MVLRVIGWLLLAGVVFAAVLAGIIALGLFNFKFISPWLYARTTRAAEAANDAYWADGIARIHTLEAKVETGAGTFTATSELICAPKSFTRPPTIKNERVNLRGTTRSGHWINVWGFGADPLSIDLPDGSRVAFPFDQNACRALERASPPPRGYPQIERASPPARTYPRDLQGTALFVRIDMATQPIGHCGVSVAKGPTAIGATTIFPVSAVSVREVRLRDILSRDAYGAAGDRCPGGRVEHPQDPSSRWLGNWDRDLSCWSKGADRGPADCAWGGEPSCPPPALEPAAPAERADAPWAVRHRPGPRGRCQSNGGRSNGRFNARRNSQIAAARVRRQGRITV